MSSTAPNDSTAGHDAARGGSAPPIFVIGSPRSGTTLTRIILNAHPTISCGPESHFLADLHTLADHNWPRVAKFDVDQEFWDARIRELYQSVPLAYMRQHGKQRWAEKTPKYTLHLPYIDRLFPDALYLHVIRDGHDVVASHRDRWGYRSAVAAPGIWARHVQTALDFGRGPAKGRYHEFRYEALVADPEKVLRPVFAFLGESWDPAVLAFNQRSMLATSRREEGGEDSNIYTTRVGAGKAALDPFLRRLLVARGGPLLRELGYLS